MELESTNSGPTAKLPILKLREYEMWAIRIKQYFQIQDYALWEVIENVDLWVSLTFSQYLDAKSMFAAIETRFGGARQEAGKGSGKKSRQTTNGGDRKQGNNEDELQKAKLAIDGGRKKNKNHMTQVACMKLYKANTSKSVREVDPKKVGRMNVPPYYLRMGADDENTPNSTHRARPPHKESISPYLTTTCLTHLNNKRMQATRPNRQISTIY
ncbi:hypothetical protein Tco_0872333 [Tanacetum coccineum]